MVYSALAPIGLTLIIGTILILDLTCVSAVSLGLEGGNGWSRSNPKSKELSFLPSTSDAVLPAGVGDAGTGVVSSPQKPPIGGESLPGLDGLPNHQESSSSSEEESSSEESSSSEENYYDGIGYPNRVIVTRSL